MLSCVLRLIQMQELPTFHFPFQAMGTPCELRLYAEDEIFAKDVADAAIDEIRRIDRAYSRYRDDNVVYAINAAAAKAGSITLDPEAADLLDIAFEAHARSCGLFDITSGALREIWHEGIDDVPDGASICGVLRRVGLGKVEWRRPRLAFSVVGMQIDLGGIGKEYAADRAAEICRAGGIANGLIDLGGDFAVVGPHPDRSPWRIGIRDPSDGETAIATLFIGEGGLATSGDYERCWEFSGRQYGHIFDPRLGFPVEGLRSVSVAAATCLDAGLASTIAMLKGKGGPDWLRDTGLPHVCIDAENHVDCASLVMPDDASIRRWMNSPSETALSAPSCPE
jgi:thiamine biosynthesis lipoprotein